MRAHTLVYEVNHFLIINCLVHCLRSAHFFLFTIHHETKYDEFTIPLIRVLSLCNVRMCKLKESFLHITSKFGTLNSANNLDALVNLDSFINILKIVLCATLIFFILDVLKFDHKAAQ